MPSSAQRLHDVDALRATLMVLGIVIHTANIYRYNPWLINSSEQHTLYSLLSEGIHLFRMPVFFLISGYFVGMAIASGKFRGSLKARIVRLVIPLITVAVTLNLVEFHVVNAFNGRELSLKDFWAQGLWMSHLWFLVNLSLYTMLVWALVALLESIGKLESGLEHLARLKCPIPLLFLAFPLIYPCILALNSFGVPLYRSAANVIDLHGFLYYFQFFALGILISLNSGLRNDFRILKPAGVIGSVLAILLFLLWNMLPSNSAPLSTLVTTYLKMLAVLLLAYVLTVTFSRLLSKPIPLARQISDASYTIYLFHHLLVILLGVMAVKFDLNPHVGFALIVALVFMLTLRIHQFISQTPLLSLLLNGKTITSEAAPKNTLRVGANH